MVGQLAINTEYMVIKFIDDLEIVKITPSHAKAYLIVLSSYRYLGKICADPPITSSEELP